MKNKLLFLSFFLSTAASFAGGYAAPNLNQGQNANFDISMNNSCALKSDSKPLELEEGLRSFNVVGFGYMADTDETVLETKITSIAGSAEPSMRRIYFLKKTQQDASSVEYVFQNGLGLGLNVKLKKATGNSSLTELVVELKRGPAGNPVTTNASFICN